ncbi:unnamed protein product [Soboliphyme baturini]|uniref:Secreted protein n=1 Tax=Soboliphyme baturini TaxID=241478 RepID=A0A183J868_9BILA|nr:unnamed protein product [Soboliphyme baturini]
MVVAGGVHSRCCLPLGSGLLGGDGDSWSVLTSSSSSSSSSSSLAHVPQPVWWGVTRRIERVLGRAKRRFTRTIDDYGFVHRGHRMCAVPCNALLQFSSLPLPSVMEPAVVVVVFAFAFAYCRICLFVCPWPCDHGHLGSFRSLPFRNIVRNLLLVSYPAAVQKWAHPPLTAAIVDRLPEDMCRKACDRHSGLSSLTVTRSNTTCFRSTGTIANRLFLVVLLLLTLMDVSDCIRSADLTGKCLETAIYSVSFSVCPTSASHPWNATDIDRPTD